MLAALRADTAWRDAKLNAELKIRKQVREEIRKYAEDRDEAIFEAVKAGVPKSRVGKEALRTTSPNVVYEALARYEQEHDLIHEVARYEKPKPRFSWEKLDDLDGGASMWALYDEQTDHYASFEKWYAERGWLLADNPGTGKRFWFGGTPGPDVLAWVEKNAPKGEEA